MNIFYRMVVLLILVGCENDVHVPINEGVTCTSDKSEVREMASALDSKKIPYLVKRIKSDQEFDGMLDDISTKLPIGEDCIFYSHQYSNELSEISSSVMGEFPPIWGRSTSWGERNDELVKVLSDHNIRIEVYVHRGKEWIAWPMEDVEKAESVLEYEDWKKEFTKAQRQGMYPPNKSKQQGPSVGTR
ncbi:hypothetical protein [uncultured Gilvimarinus sp.]|uniref:hypothetical protein n=1 Tax=uncultured Gilvimarinus sp. TaxID=1689143 RepID=UPI0030EEEE05|tara:strand:+ start:1561 stop:2124 length:564 start_codon:yes stop_codon:yes gene_type:complete